MAKLAPSTARMPPMMRSDVLRAPRRFSPKYMASISATQMRADLFFLASDTMQGRLTEPVYKAAGDDHYRPVGWDEAFQKLSTDFIAGRAAPPGGAG